MPAEVKHGSIVANLHASASYMATMKPSCGMTTSGTSSLPVRSLKMIAPSPGMVHSCDRLSYEGIRHPTTLPSMTFLVASCTIRRHSNGNDTAADMSRCGPRTVVLAGGSKTANLARIHLGDFVGLPLFPIARHW